MIYGGNVVTDKAEEHTVCKGIAERGAEEKPRIGGVGPLGNMHLTLGSSCDTPSTLDARQLDHRLFALQVIRFTLQ